MISSSEQFALDTFAYTYELQKSVFDKNWITGNGRPIYVGIRNPRKCYFCGKTKGQTTFRQDAHLIPECIGNRNILSLHECDECNRLFSHFDNALAAYIGPVRCFWRITTKKGRPNFKDPHTNLKINNATKTIMVTSRQEGDPEFTIDEANNTLKLSLKKEGYIPVLAFKALVKIGISLLEEEEVEQFSTTIDWLKSDSKPEYLHWDFSVLPWTFVGTQTLRPEVRLFKRKVIELDGKALEKCVLLRFGRMQYQYFIPFSRHDILLSRSTGGTWNVPAHPFILPDLPGIEKFPMQRENLNSWEKRIREEQELIVTSTEPMIRSRKDE
jgi:hypothetical protein